MITEDLIVKVIFQIFPNYKYKNKLSDIVAIIINCIKSYFFDENSDSFYQTLTLNNYRNLKAIILAIFYYIKPENYSKFKNFRSLELPEMTNIRREFLRVIPNENNKFNIDVNNKIGLDDEQYLTNFSQLFISSLMKISNKLYVNWINVQPISFPEVQKTKNFENTVKSIGTYRDDIQEFLNEKELKNYKFKNRLYIGDIYNIIRNFLYERIKMYKLMIFYYVENNKLVQYYDKLNEFTDKNIYYEYIDYRFLPQKEKEKFQKLVTFLSNLTYNNDPNKLFSEDDMKLYFGIYYFNQIPFAKIEDKDKKLYNILKKQLYNSDEDEKKEITFFARNIDNNKLNKIYNTYINNSTYIAEYYKYIQQQIIGYRKTIYPLDEGPNSLFPKGYQKKIFYNFFKIMMIDYENKEKDKLKILPFQYDHLTQKQKNKFVSQINNILGVKFTISNIEKKSNGLINKDEYVSIIKDRLVYIFYYALINEGILSKVVYNPKCVDDNELGKDNKFLKRNMRKYVFTKEKIKNFNECNYYLGNTSYKDIKIPNYELNRKFTIYEHLSEKKYGLTYYTQYALNWVSQIFLYFKFINCRILYITGGTGVGKSTQVPKLLQYSLKAFSYKIAGKVICTQPRIDPTEGVSTRVAEELSVPIQVTINNVKVLEPSLNKFVQFKHKKNKIVDDYTDTYLRFVTDGLFFEQLRTNPSLKEEEILSFTSKKDNYLKIQNKYDVVAIDEAHEHNKNMDYILSIMRNSLYYNNDLKLVIISATMDDDEKVYRYFYRHIDDNLKYPLSSSVLEPVTLKPEQRLTRYFIDRRVHIEAPPEPGKSSTKFPIKDIYLDFDTDYEMAEKESIKTVTKICNDTSEGHILLFTTGTAEIQNLSKIFLKILPENVLIFPYFSAMPNAEKYKDDVQKIDTRISNYNINRSSFVDFMFKVIKENQIEKGNFSYDRALIIATNVAEASITIRNLKFVVDIGYYNFVGYDYNTDLPKVRKEKIDDNSRAQRRGRTGRTNAGTVYYMYREGDRKKVTSIKSIEAENITFDILKLLSDDKNNESNFFDKNFDPYYSKLVNKNIKKEDLLNNFKNKRGYDKIIENQFLYEGDLLNEKNIDFRNRYLISNNLSKTQIFEELNNTDFRIYYSFKETGFDPEMLFDNYGMFYIVHPEERNIQRLNTFVIINYRKTENDDFISWNANLNEIKFDKLKKIYNQLENYFFIKKDMNYSNYDYKKTFFIQYFNDIIGSELDFMVDKITNSNELLIITYIISKIFNCSHDIIILNSLLKASSYNLRNLIYFTEKFNPKKNKLEKIFIIDKYKTNINYSHQLIQLYNIGINILSEIMPILQKKFRQKSIYIDFQKFSKIDKSFVEKEINQNDVSKIITKYNKNLFSLSVKERQSLKKIIELTNEKEITIYKYLINTLNPIISNFFLDNKELINYISKDLEINNKVIIEFIKTYISNIIVDNFDDKLKEKFKILTDIIMFNEDKKNSILNCFYNSYKLKIDYLSNNKKDMIKTDKGFQNIGIETDEKFFYLNMNQFKPNEKIYSIINKLNFNIIDIKNHTETLEM